MTYEMWHMAGGERWTFFQNFSSLALTVWEWRQIWTKPNKPGKTGQKQAKKTRTFLGKNGQNTGERNQTLAKQGETKSFAESRFGFAHPWSVGLPDMPLTDKEFLVRA